MRTITKAVGYRYRIYPNMAQRVALSQLFGCVRYVYNWGLSRCKAHYRRTGKNISSYDLSKELTHHKREPDKLWLNDVLRMPLRVSLFHLDEAYKNFFEKRANKPKFKKKTNNQKATITYQYFSIKNNKLNINKIPGLLKIRWSRYWSANAQVKALTVSKDVSGRYFVSFRVYEKIVQLQPLGAKIGIDMGSTHFLATSEGEKVPNPRCFVKKLKKYRRLCRAFYRKKQGSKNREKARLKKAKLSVKIADCHRDFQHKLSTRLIRENQAIGLENLHVKSMLQHRYFSKSIAAASWSSFFALLKYKGDWYGRHVVTPDNKDRPLPSSKICSVCGYILDDLPPHIRTWTCPKCKRHHDRDVNAAINIRNHTVGETGL